MVAGPGPVDVFVEGIMDAGLGTVAVVFVILGIVDARPGPVYFVVVGTVDAGLGFFCC